MPQLCSVDAPALFIEHPDDGHWVFKCWLLEVCCSCVFIFSELSWCFDELSMLLLWYFSDTFMILFVKRNEKYHWGNVLFIRWIALNLMQKWDFETFFAEKTFFVRKIAVPAESIHRIIPFLPFLRIFNHLWYQIFYLCTRKQVQTNWLKGVKVN